MGLSNQLLSIYDPPDIGNGIAGSSGFVGTAGTPGTGGISNGITNPNYMNSTTGILSQPLNYLSNLISGVSTSNAAVVANGPIANALGLSGTNLLTGQNASNTPGSSFSDSVTAIFLRGVVIVTGMIFVAEGLSMFKGNPSTIVNMVKRAGKAVS